VLIVMGKTDLAAERHRQQSMILVPKDTPGVEVKRGVHVFGYTDGPHGGHGEVDRGVGERYSGAGGVGCDASASYRHCDFLGRQVAVAIAEAGPGGFCAVQLQVGAWPSTDDEQDRLSVAGSGGQAAGQVRAAPG
jgi:hypothetical protein